MTLFANRYEEIKPLGSGTSGTVYLVKDQKTGRECALKVLQNPLGHLKTIELENFQKEFEILKDLNHPSIAKVYDTGILEKTKHLYLATEYINGADLFKATEEKSIDFIEHLFVQTLRALNYLHQQKVYHLDIKPQNLLVTINDQRYAPQGKPWNQDSSPEAEGLTRQGSSPKPTSVGDKNEPAIKVIDFGLANFYERDFLKSQGEKITIVGTVAFMPPEIIKGEPHDGRADLYSLGCAFYRAFTRELPFMGEAFEIRQKHLSEAPVKPSAIKGNIPVYLDKILLRLLEKEAANRYASAKAVIDDLNLLTGKDYEVETKETVLSYIPQTGKLIGREEEYKKFLAHYDDRIFIQECQKKPYIIISGKEGCGKSRFLEECMNEAKKEFIPTLSWMEFMKLSTEKVPEKCLIVGDNITIQAKELEYLEVFFEKNPILAILTTSQENIPCAAESVINLNNFSREQTREYLLKATGLSNITENDLDEIYKITGGNPLYVSGVVRTFFKSGVGIDSHGNWSQQVYNDLGLKIEETGVKELIKTGLQKELKALPLQLGHWQVLNMLALAGRPTLNDLQSMSGAFSIGDALKDLADHDILKVDAENLYAFTNPLYKEIILEQMNPQEKAEYCDVIADYYEAHQADPDIILYYRGRGTTKEALSCLLKLAQKKRESLEYQEAKENLTELLSKPHINQDTKDQALLELGEICIEQGKYEEGEKHLLQIIQSQDILIAAKAYEQVGLSFNRRGNHSQAEHYYQKGLEVASKTPELKWMQVILKNRLAQKEIDLGNLDKAEEILKQTWNVWKNDLNEEEKILAARSDIDALYYSKQEYQKAIDYLEELLGVLSKKPHLNIYPVKIYMLGRCYLRIGNLNKAEKLLNECLEAMKARKTPHWLYAVYNELGALFERKGDLEKALSYYQHTFDLARRTSSENVFYGVAFNMANVLMEMGKLDEALKYYNFVIDHLQSKDFSDKITTTYWLYSGYLDLANIYRQQSHLEQAKNHLSKARHLFETSPHLKSQEQYFWQEKADLEQSQKNTGEAKKALDALQALSKTTAFDQQEYQKWYKSFLEIKG